MGFLLFVLVVFTLYLRVWHKVAGAFFKGHPVAFWVSLGVTLLLFFMPVVTRMLSLPAGFSRIMEQLGWICLAWVFWMWCILLLFDVWNVALWLISFLPRCSDALRFFAGDRLAVYAALAFTATATLWGVVEAGCIALRTVELATDKMPEGLHECRIALVTDVHIGPAASYRRLKKMLRLLEEAKPDLLLSAGDFIDGRSAHEEEMARFLGASPIASGRRYGVLGNHDCYSGIDVSRKLHQEAKITLLEKRGELVDGWLWLYGEDDPASGRRMEKRLTGLPEGRFTIFLRHQPIWGGGDLQVSGHSHGGQIFPFNFLVRTRYPYKESILHPVEGGYIYVSPGSGVWGPPFRVFARPEVTLFIIRNKKEQK